jgi:lysophospholipase L1-like esterase
MTVRTRLWLLALMLCSSSQTICASEKRAIMSPMDEPVRKLVIIGASYAAEWGQPALPGFEIVNKGVGGEESSAVRARFERDALSLAPQVVLIWGHYNDVVRAPPERRGEVAARTKENYRTMVEQARAAGAQVVLATEITIPIADTWSERAKAQAGWLLGKVDYRRRVNAVIVELNEWLRVYAQQQHIVLLDFERALASSNGTRRVEFTRTDGSHVNAAGYEALTRYSSETLHRLLRTENR